MLQRSSDLTGTRQLRGAFSDTEDFLDHGLVSANRCSSRTSSISSWTENIKPSFTKKLKFQSVLEGEPVELKCKLVAYPPPTILWFHNNRSVPKEHRRRICTDSRMHMHTTSLVIDSIKEKDSGSYKVMAINTEGSADSTASLLVSLREEQSANYLGFVRCSAKAHESIDNMAEQRKERKFKVELRCVGSPFDKMSKVHQGRSRSKTALVRTVYFGSGSHSKEESEKECKRLETASERAPSPPPMFDRSERFNDRFSDIYCDRRTGARFSDKFSDRCSDRYSERFSDTESLHNEVRTKLTTLQKAVKQKKRLSISTMSSSEFELESVASESSYAEYVEKLRVKPASLPDVPHFNRPFDLGESHREFRSNTSSGAPSQPRVRHSFEPQSRTRAIQIMRGELVDTLVTQTEQKSDVKHSETLKVKEVKSFVECQADDKFMKMENENHCAVPDPKVESTMVAIEFHQPEVPYSETLTYPENTIRTDSKEPFRMVPVKEEVSLTESPRAYQITSIREKYLSEAITPTKDTADRVELYEDEGAGESLRAQYEKSLEAERMECEDKLLALRIRKWQQGSRMSEEETFHPETALPILSETHYTEPAGPIYSMKEVVEERSTLEPKVPSFQKSPRINERVVDSEDATTPKSPKVKAKREEVETRSTELEAELSPGMKARDEDRLTLSPRSRPDKSLEESFRSEAVTSGGIARETAEQFEEESLRAKYEKSLEAERMECEEKLLALRIRKWQQGMQMSEGETFHPKTDLPMPSGKQYMEPEGYIQQQVVEKRDTVDHVGMSPKVKGKVQMDKPSTPIINARTKRPGELEPEAQPSPRVKARAAEMEAQTSPTTQKMLFEKTRDRHELQLSRENISELKNESEKFVSEEEALTQRIMKWQQDVQMEQEQAVKVEPDWVEGYTSFQREGTIKVGHDVPEAPKVESFSPSELFSSSKTFPGPVVKEKVLLSKSVSAACQDQQGDGLQWPPTDELPTEGRETRLQRDSEYIVSEEEALAQRILKWQQDVTEQEEVAELESEWTLDNQAKQPGPRLPTESHATPFDSKIYHSVTSHEIHLSQLPPPHTAIAGGTLPTNIPSPIQHAADHKTFPHEFPTGAGLVHSLNEPIDSSYDLKSTPVKDRICGQASLVQGLSPIQPTSAPFEGSELVSAQGKSHRKAPKEFSSIRSYSPCSPQEDVGTEPERRQSREQYGRTVRKSSSQGFQSNVSQESDMKEDSGPTTETSNWRQQKDFSVNRREEGTGGSIRTKQDEKEERRVLEITNLKEGVRMDECVDGSFPVFVKEMSSVKVKIGEMSEFTCQFQGEPLPSVTWLKDGHPLGHNPDYDIMSKSNKSKLTVFYPTTDHEGTYDCVITNRHGKSICSATLEIVGKKIVKTSGVRQQVAADVPENDEENLEGIIEKELQSYMGSGKAMLQVPQAVIHKHRCSDESFSSSPVEIRITAATPVPEMMEESNEDKPQAFAEKTPDVSSDEGASQNVKHKFTFSFDVVSIAPHVINELESITCAEGNTAVLECVIKGEPAPEVAWCHNDIGLDITSGKYTIEIHDKVYKLYINNFTYTDAGVYKCVAKNRLGEVTSISHVSFQVTEPAQFSEGGGVLQDDVFTPSERVIESPVGVTGNIKKSAKTGNTTTEERIIQTKDKHYSQTAKAPKSRPIVSKELPNISGCGLQASAAVIKVSQMKQAFESDSPVTLADKEQKQEMHFPEEFIPPVAVSLDLQEHINAPKPCTIHTEGHRINPGSPKTVPEAETEMDITEADSVVPKAVSYKSTLPTFSVEEESEIHVISADVEEGAVLAERHDVVKRFVEEVQEFPELVRPKPQRPVTLQTEADQVERAKEETVPAFDRTSSFIPFQSEKVSVVKQSIRTSAPAPAEDVVRPKRIHKSLKPVEQTGAARSSPVHSEAENVSSASAAEEWTEVEKHIKQEAKGINQGYVFMPKEKRVSKEGESSYEELISVPEPSLDSGVFLSLPDSKADVPEGTEETVTGDVVESPPITGDDEITDGDVRPKPKLFIAKSDADRKVKGPSLDKASAAETGGTAAPAGFMEEEEVTFGAVYDYYNPSSEWGRPLSPESEMSIEIGSTVSEEIAEVAERFYTPGSSTEVSQLIVESFQTPSSNAPGGFMTPQEYPFSPEEHKRPSTGDSTERFFSPLQFLTPPANEDIITTSHGKSVDENRFLNKDRESLGLPTVQEKVQGIPPAFLKPLIKKRVFENDSLTFYAEVFGLPSPEVKWFSNKTELVADDRVKMQRDGDSISLTIHNVSKADQGEYICEAVNYVGEARSVALVVVVSQEVRFMPAPPAVTHQHVMEFDVEEDDSSRSPSPQEILLEVELDEIEVKEFEKQVKIITIPEYTADNKSMILSLDVLPSIYEEGAVDFITQEHDDLKIAFEVTEMPPRFINPICDMETPEGTTVMFECSLMGIPSPIISWFKGDKKIPHNNKKYLHSSDGDNHFLKICKVTTQDSGVYTCRAINIVGETLCRASLVVLNAKAFSGKTRGRELTAVSLGSAIVQPQKFDLMVGNTSFDDEQVSEIELEFEFEQEADESQRAVRLVANTDNEMSEQGEKYVSINFDVFAEPAKDDKIEFKGKSSDMCSFHFQVTETSPKCIIPLTNVTASVGTPVILQCLVTGKPNPTAEWYKDGDRVTDSRCIIQEKTAGHFNLLITNVIQSDAGEYKCIIQNTAGCIETTALLKVF